MRQSENFQGWPRHFHLWCWTNPHPDRLVESLTIRLLGPRFVVGAVTLGFEAEPPFIRSAKREVKIVLSMEADAEQLFGLEVEVERGVATSPI